MRAPVHRAQLLNGITLWGTETPSCNLASVTFNPPLKVPCVNYHSFRWLNCYRFVLKVCGFWSTVFRSEMRKEKILETASEHGVILQTGRRRTAVLFENSCRSPGICFQLVTKPINTYYLEGFPFKWDFPELVTISSYLDSESVKFHGLY